MRYLRNEPKYNLMKLPRLKVSQVPLQARAAKAANRLFSLYSQGGTGKTSIVKSVVAPALGIAPEDVFIVNLSGADPAAVIGYGIPDHDTRDMYFSSPEIWPTAERHPNDRPKLLCLDEAPDYDSGVNSLCRSLYNPDGGPGKIGTHTIADNTFVMRTGNRRTDGSSRSTIPSAPEVERTFSYELINPLDDWLEGYAFQHEGIADSPIIAFLQFNNGLKGVDHFCPPIPAPWDGSPHPCPRTWEAACRAERFLFNDADAGPADVSLAIRGAVGEDSGNAAFAFAETVAKDLPLIKKIRAGEAELPEDTSQQYGVVYAGIRTAVRESRKDPEAAVAGGAVDWLVDRFICKAMGEVRTWAYTAAVNSDLPLAMHPRRDEMQGV